MNTENESFEAGSKNVNGSTMSDRDAKRICAKAENERGHSERVRA